MIFLANTYWINYSLPLWYPLITLGLFIILCICRYNKHKITGDPRTDKMISGAVYVLLFASELVYITFPHQGETMFYYMAPDVVGWMGAIVAVLLTVVVIFAQFLYYLEFTANLHAHRFTYVANMAAVCAVVVITGLKTIGLFESFIDEYLYIFILVVVAVLTLCAIVQNIIEKTYWQMVVEIPLLLLGLFISVFAAVVVFVLVVLFCVFGLFSMVGSGDSSTPAITRSSSSPGFVCRNCVYHDRERQYCTHKACYRDESDPACDTYRC